MKRVFQVTTTTTRRNLNPEMIGRAVRLGIELFTPTWNNAVEVEVVDVTAEEDAAAAFNRAMEDIEMAREPEIA